MELMEVDNLEGSAHTPVYNPRILPLNLKYKKKNKNFKFKLHFSTIQ